MPSLNIDPKVPAVVAAPEVVAAPAPKEAVPVVVPAPREAPTKKGPESSPAASEEAPVMKKKRFHAGNTAIVNGEAMTFLGWSANKKHRFL